MKDNLYYVCATSFEHMHTKYTYPLATARKIIKRARRRGIVDVYLSSPVTRREVMS